MRLVYLLNMLSSLNKDIISIIIIIIIESTAEFTYPFQMFTVNSI